MPGTSSAFLCAALMCLCTLRTMLCTFRGLGAILSTTFEWYASDSQQCEIHHGGQAWLDLV